MNAPAQRNRFQLACPHSCAHTQGSPLENTEGSSEGIEQSGGKVIAYSLPQ